jgi:hypothetical protein
VQSTLADAPPVDQSEGVPYRPPGAKELPGACMRPATVRIVDIGMGTGFDLAGSFARSVIDSLTWVGDGIPPAEVEFIRTRSWNVLADALVEPCSVLHLMAHGETRPEELGFWSDDEKSSVQLGDLANALDYTAETGDRGVHIQAPLLFADCCGTSQGRFVRAMRDCIGQDTAYVGSRRDVNWHESTLFGSLLYGSYFKDKGRGLKQIERAEAAAERAIAAYDKAVSGPCPFALSVLRPSRRALRRTRRD